MYNVYGSQTDVVDRVTRAFILRMRSLGQNGPLRRDTIFAVARITCSQLLIVGVSLMYATGVNPGGIGGTELQIHF